MSSGATLAELRARLARVEVDLSECRRLLREMQAEVTEARRLADRARDPHRRLSGVEWRDG